MKAIRNSEVMSILMKGTRNILKYLCTEAVLPNPGTHGRETEMY